MNALLTQAKFDTAVDIIRPAIGITHGKDITTKLAGAFVVLDPRTGEVLFEADIDPNHEKAQQYRVVARGKADMSWVTGLPSREVQQSDPFIYEVGDIKWGGAVVRGLGQRKLVVAFSGVQAAFDEMFAGWLADTLVALCRYEMETVVMKGDDAVVAASAN